MRPEELAALGDLAGDAASWLTSQVREMHAGIAGRVFDAVGDAGAPVRVAHDEITDGAYEAARLLASGLLRGGGRMIARTRPSDARPIDHSPRARLAVGALNGAFGDGLHRRGNGLALSMSVRRGGRDVTITPAALADAFPDATGRLALFVWGAEREHHHGAPLEQAATATAAALARLPETRGIAQALNARSSGIKDLGHGYLIDEDWVDQDPFAFIQQSAFSGAT